MFNHLITIQEMVLVVTWLDWPRVARLGRTILDRLIGIHHALLSCRHTLDPCIPEVHTGRQAGRQACMHAFVKGSGGIHINPRMWSCCPEACWAGAPPCLGGLSS